MLHGIIGKRKTFNPIPRSYNFYIPSLYHRYTIAIPWLCRFLGNYTKEWVKLLFNLAHCYSLLLTDLLNCEKKIIYKELTINSGSAHLWVKPFFNGHGGKRALNSFYNLPVSAFCRANAFNYSLFNQRFQ